MFYTALRTINELKNEPRPLKLKLLLNFAILKITVNQKICKFATF